MRLVPNEPAELKFVESDPKVVELINKMLDMNRDILSQHTELIKFLSHPIMCYKPVEKKCD